MDPRLAQYEQEVGKIEAALDAIYKVSNNIPITDTEKKLIKAIQVFPKVNSDMFSREQIIAILEKLLIAGLYKIAIYKQSIADTTKKQ